jgi:hypothetical protein
MLWVSSGCSESAFVLCLVCSLISIVLFIVFVMFDELWDWFFGDIEKKKY